MKNIYSKTQANNVFSRINHAWNDCVFVGDNVVFVANRHAVYGVVTAKWGGVDKRLVVKDNYTGKVHELRDLSKVCVFSRLYGAYLPLTENYVH